MLPLVLAAAGALLLRPHLFLDRTEALTYVARWKPQVVAGRVVSVSGVGAYTRALLHVRADACVGMLCTDANVAFVLHRTNGTECVSSVLWNGPRPSVAAFRALRAWYRHHGIPLPDARMLTDHERDLWEVSRMEA